jgi:hypothetical protein
LGAQSVTIGQRVRYKKAHVKPQTALVAIALLFRAGAAQAGCETPNQLSTCIDVDTLWSRAGSGRFSFVGPATTTAAGTFALGLVSTYLKRPLVLQAPASVLGGTEIVAVDQLWDTTLLWAFGLSRSFEISLALPFTTYRSGTGLSALSSQRSRELSRTAVRDLRLGSAFALARGQTSSGLGYAVASHLELALPSGEASSLAGDRFAVLVPSFAAELSYARFFVAGELGARLRATSELAGSRVGSQLHAALGIGVGILADNLLSLQLEAMTLPTLAAQHELARSENVAERVVTGSRPWLVPTEWQASLRSAFLTDTTSISLGAGGALPLSGEYGITSPSYRVILALRYQPPSAGH